LANAGTARTNLGLGTGAVLNTAAIANAGTGLATADQIHTFVTGLGYITSYTDTNTWRGITAGGNTLSASEVLAFTAGANMTITESAGAVTLTSTDTNTTYSVGAGGLTQQNFTTTLKNKLDAIAASATNTVDLTVSGAGTVHANNYTDTNTTYAAMGSGNSYAAGLVLAGSNTHGGLYLRKDGSWQNPDTDTNTQNEYATSWVDSSADALLRLTESGAGSGTQDLKIVAGSNITLTPYLTLNLLISS
jgi:hypothetical protein